MKCSFLAPLALSLLLAGCATTALKPASTQAVNFTVISPLTRTSDAGERHCLAQSLQDGSIDYKVCRDKDGGGRSISFADAKRGVKIKIRELQ